MRTRNSYVGVVAAFAAISCILASSVGAQPRIYPLAVQLLGILPQHGTAGDLVTINGLHLETTKAVSFGTVDAESISVDPGGFWVKVVVPAGVPDGPVQITLLVEGLRQSIGPFIIGTGSVPSGVPSGAAKPSAVGVAPAPRITQFSPTAGKAGTKVTINGANLGKASWLKFGGVRAKFTVSSANWIIAIVPKNAHSGKITVHTSGGTAVSSKRFKV
jgi:hypothetical protein